MSSNAEEQEEKIVTLYKEHFQKIKKEMIEEEEEPGRASTIKRAIRRRYKISSN
ncbi:MAG: hypothetical protein PVH88_16595 [Ignavibacteria bacterium]|jgi:hypothetical protein